MGKSNTHPGAAVLAQLMTAQDVARIVACSDKVVYRMAACGEIPCVRIASRIVRFDPQDIANWLASKKQVDDGL